jgi:hypothetical protein
LASIELLRILCVFTYDCIYTVFLIHIFLLKADGFFSSLMSGNLNFQACAANTLLNPFERIGLLLVRLKAIRRSE